MRHHSEPSAASWAVSQSDWGSSASGREQCRAGPPRRFPADHSGRVLWANVTLSPRHILRSVSANRSSGASTRARRQAKQLLQVLRGSRRAARALLINRSKQPRANDVIETHVHNESSVAAETVRVSTFPSWGHVTLLPGRDGALPVAAGASEATVTSVLVGCTCGRSMWTVSICLSSKKGTHFVI